MTEKERVKKSIVEILVKARRATKPCPHGNVPWDCPTCLTDAILAIPGLFVEDEAARPSDVYHTYNRGWINPCCVTTMVNARAKGWKKAAEK